ncbi:MAG: substrate-binding domain-containing protein [Gemmatimonadota bacterium]|nr:MAG: substrate-binding domain-containing protein [Gemmatimonadota bacterium]
MLQRLGSVGLVLASFLPGRLPAQAPADAEVVLATTTSVRDAGLLQAILPPFERASGYRIKVIAVGSGQAMELGRRGEADILIVHAPEEEREFLRAGFGVERDAFMRNAFVIVGPAADPARARGSNLTAALRSIAAGDALFVSRADRSGTHLKEAALWRLVGVEPDRSWHRESGQGMSATLQIANELQAYTLTDIGTLLSHEYPLDLEVLVEGDSLLANPYHVVLASPQRFPWLNSAGARALRDYLVSVDTQRAIGAFGRERFGRALFEPAMEF